MIRGNSAPREGHCGHSPKPLAGHTPIDSARVRQLSFGACSAHNWHRTKANDGGEDPTEEVLSDTQMVLEGWAVALPAARTDSAYGCFLFWSVDSSALGV
jgi:hypothetical protein